MHPTVAAYCFHGTDTVQLYEEPPTPDRNDTQDINMAFIGGFIAMLCHSCLPIFDCSEILFWKTLQKNIATIYAQKYPATSATIMQHPSPDWSTFNIISRVS